MNAHDGHLLATRLNFDFIGNELPGTQNSIIVGRKTLLCDSSSLPTVAAAVDRVQHAAFGNDDTIFPKPRPISDAAGCHAERLRTGDAVMKLVLTDALIIASAITPELTFPRVP
jgi:hypothetical protein